MTFIVAQTETDEPRMALFSAATRTAVRYADPMSWTAATAVAEALAGPNGGASDLRHRIGVITISDAGPAQAIAGVAEASAAGFSSPMRYPASNPGSLAGVVCIAHGLRGPTINFTMTPALAIPSASALARAWIDRRKVPLLVLLASTRMAADRYLARCLLLAPNPFDAKPAEAMSDVHLNWLTSATRLNHALR